MKSRRTMNTAVNSLPSFSEDFMSERNQPPVQDRTRMQMEKQNNKPLPVGWEWKTLGELCKTTSGGTPSRKRDDYFGGDIPWVKSGELPDGIVANIEEYITEEAVKKSSAKLFPPGTLLIALYGATVGKLGILKKAATTNQAICAIFPTENLQAKYLFWFLRYMRSDLIAQAIGGAQPNISQGILRNLLIPVAPINQQHLIVSEIEKQFSRLDEAVAGLKRIKANLKRYKASVLKAAVEGKLTEEWRKAHPNVQTGAELLKRILAERGKKWEEKNPAKKYKEPAGPDTSNLPGLPEGWVWATVEQLSSLVTDGDHNPPKRIENGVPHLTAKNVVHGKLIEVGCTYISAGDFEKARQRYEPQRDDVIITCVGTLGRTAIVPPDYLFSADRNLASVRLINDGMRPRMLQFSLDTQAAQKKIHVASGSTAQPHLYLADLRAFTVALMPQNEQCAIIDEIESCLSVAEEIEATVEINLKRAEQLRQSILNRAFSGQLLSQDGISYKSGLVHSLPMAAEEIATYGDKK